MAEEVSVSPECLFVKLKFDGQTYNCFGTVADMREVDIQNDGQSRVIYKLKVSHPDRFILSTTCRFVDQQHLAKIQFNPRPFSLDSLPREDHLSIRIRQAPAEATDPKEFWTAAALSEPENQRKIVVRIVYTVKQTKKSLRKQVEEDDDDDLESEGKGAAEKFNQSQKANAPATSNQTVSFDD